MSPETLQVVVIYLALVAVLAGAAAAGVRCGVAVRAGVVVGEILLVVQALLDVISYLRGHRPAETATHLGYLVVSVVLLPRLGWAGARGSRGVALRLRRRGARVRRDGSRRPAPARHVELSP